MLHFSNAKGRVSDLPTEILMWIGGFGGVREWVMMRRVNKNWASLPAIPLLSYYGFRASLSGRYLPPKYPPPLLNVQYGISRDEVLFLMEMNSEEAALKVLKTRTFSQDFYQRILDWGAANIIRLPVKNHDILFFLVKTFDLDLCRKPVLRWACKLGDAELVKKILKNSTFDQSSTQKALSETCANSNQECFDILMEDGRFDPSVLNNDPLRQAVHRKSYGIIRKLLSMEQVDPSCNDNEFLQFAVMHRDIQTIKWLLQDPRVDPNSSIDSVVEEGNETIISLLLQTNKLRRVELDMAVQVSVSRNFPSITKMLLPLVNPEANDHALTMAVTMETIRHRHGITAFKLFLKDERVDITCRDNILLLSAVRTRSEEMVRLLIQAGGDVNANNGEAMKTAIQDLSGGVIDVILEAKGYIPEESHLYQAILLRNTRLARKLIPLVNPGYDNNLCIKTAAKGGLTGIMEELIKDPRVDPRLAVFKATSLDILDILLSDPRVDPSIKNSRVLLFAVENGDAEMFERLFEDGRVDFSVRNNVALTTAVDLSNWGMVEKLLKVEKVDPTMYEYINIRKTCLLGQFDLAEKMLRHVNSDGFIQTVIEIQMAVQQKNVSLFEELVEISGLDLSVFDNWFVAVAAVAGDSECAKVIFECPSVDPSVDNQKHFIDACEKGHAGVVKEFLKHPKINPALNYFQALNVAYAHGNHEVLRILKRDRRCFVWSEPDEDDLCTNCDEDPCICNDFDEDDPGFPGPPDCLQQ